MDSEPIAHFRQSDQKPQTLQDHLLSTSDECGKITQKVGLREIGELLGLLHDFGKINPTFQNYLKSAVGMIDPDADDFIPTGPAKGKIDHSTLGAKLAYQKWGEKGKKGKIAAQIMALCLASHHSGLINCLSLDGQNKFQDRINKKLNPSSFNFSIDDLPEVSQRLKALLSSNIEEILFQKLYSLQEESLDTSPTMYFKHGLLIRFLLSCLIDADRINTADFEFPGNKQIRQSGNYPSWKTLNNRLDRKLKGFEEKADKNRVDSIRSSVSSACFEAAKGPQGIFQLTVPTGGGKTLASLRFAINHAAKHNLKHIFIIIPYTSIIDQNAREIRHILENQSEDIQNFGAIVLEHHSNLTPEKQTYRQALLAENWDAPIVITTQVQFLEALFSGSTRSTRRMHQLANSVIIFDEVQNLPINCIHMFNVALRFLVKDCHSSAVLCTATQPLLDKVQSAEKALPISPNGQIIKNEGELFGKLKRVEILDQRKPGGWEISNTVRLALEEVDKKGSVLIIVNTRKSAKALHEAIAHEHHEHHEHLFHLSTNMCPRHRLATLDQVKSELEKGCPVICVSTQLIEAGVDIDFGAVIRHLAGLDSIAQAAGRCNRHGRQKDAAGNPVLGRVTVINPAYESLNGLREIQIAADKTQRVLDEYREQPAFFKENLIGLEALDRFYRYYFFARQNEMDYPIEHESYLGHGDNLFNLLSVNSKSLNTFNHLNHQPPEMQYLQSFATAGQIFRVIDAVTQGVIVPYQQEGHEIIQALGEMKDLADQKALLRQSQQISVNLYSNEFNKLLEIGAVHEAQEGMGIFHLETEYYSDVYGWQFDPNDMDQAK